DSHELDSDSSAPPTHGEPTVDTAAESECEDFLNDIVNGDVTPVRYDPAFAATPNTLKRKRDSSDRSELGKRALVKPLLRRRGNEGDVPHEKHPENPARQCNDTVAVGKDDTSKGLRFLHLSTGTASAGSLSDGLTQHDPPVSHAGGALPDQNLSPDQSEVERGTEITLSAKFRLDVESLVCIPTSELSTRVDVSQVNELESKGEALWTGERGPTAIAGHCGPQSIRKLAARKDDRLNDEIVNTIPIIAVPADNRTYLLPSYAFEHIRKGLSKQAGDIYTAADDVRNCGVYVAWVLREWMHGRPGDAEEFPGHLEFRIEMLQLLQGAFRTPGLPSVGDVLGSPSTSMTDIHP
ncbi:hypothetical protein LTR03_018106, partial [Friedmanniomyces endolithicus]